MSTATVQQAPTAQALPHRPRKGRFHGGGRGGNRGKTRGHDQQAKTPEEAVPIRRYGPGNNWIIFKETMIYALGAKYGDLGRIVKDEAYNDPPPIDTSQYDRSKDPHGLQLDELKEQVKDRQKLISAMRNNRTSCYNFIISTDRRD